MKFPSYDSYANINHPWFPKAPSHWHLSKLKYLFELVKEPAKEHDEIVTCFRDGEVTLRKNRREDGFTNALKEIGYQHVEVNNLVIHAMDAFAGAIGVSDSSGKSSPVYSVCRPIEGRSNSRYFAKLLRHMALSGFVESLGKGIRERSTDFRWADAGNIKLPVPPTKEQHKIAQFLDYETAKIDALIDEQKRLIELLKEKRQAVISHAVTKGVNSDAPMKDSGVDWLGEVPEYWSIVYSKYLFDFVTSGSRGWADYYSDEGSLFFRIANLTRDTIEPKLESVQNVTPPHGSEGERSRIKINDILFSITADLGSVCVADESIADGYVSQHVALARPSAKVNSSRWLAYALISDSSKAQILGSGYGGTKIQLSLNDVKEVVLVEPSKAEQVEIADYLDSSLAKMNNLLEQAESLISLLTERRSALISAAVTGKIDVRDWQPPAGSDTVDSNALVQTERHYG